MKAADWQHRDTVDRPFQAEQRDQQRRDWEKQNQPLDIAETVNDPVTGRPLRHRLTDGTVVDATLAATRQARTEELEMRNAELREIADQVAAGQIQATPIVGPDGKVLAYKAGNRTITPDDGRMFALIEAIQGGAREGGGQTTPRAPRTGFTGWLDGRRQDRHGGGQETEQDALSGRNQQGTPQTPPAPQMPQIGEVRISMSRGPVRYRGGDPRDNENWEPVEQQ